MSESLTLKVPLPAERQVTESKWDAAQQCLAANPEVDAQDALLTPRHVYTVVREPDGTFTRTRTKSREGINVGLASSPCARDLHPVSVGDSLHDDAASGM
jgi:hypothetical protein